ncbi:hypothetical protein BDU57DRAFT_589176 [Ampelomyces quisqualis]|uniref:Heterokaryon incompatibility domain-containing protein n=1 Tax=Ampelomyces quisqualis TaxID=50730 RepID=A0A6A5QFC2_AMPQU|nr:hypothetical protein BDU57DRAFT_589176 [Ampelomyces quisqualis]
MSEKSDNFIFHNSSHTTEPYAIHTPLSPSCFQLTLSSTNKAEIFSEALTELHKSHDQTYIILNNLKRWNPEAASYFSIRSRSTILSTSFRLVYPKIDLPSFDKNGLYPRQFIAISYCWRSPEFLPEGYDSHDVWPIKKSLVDAILAEKPHPRVGIWIDQMCIDQSSVLDQKASVAAMDVIYRSCLQLVILLEDVLLTDQEIQLVEKYNVSKRPFNKGWKFEAEEIGTFASFYDKVNAARWWSRAWCYHEFCVHQPWLDRRQTQAVFHATFIMCGPDDSTAKIKWKDLHLLMGSASSALPNSPIWWKGQATVAGAIKPEIQETGRRGSIMARHNVVSELGSCFLADCLSVVINLCGLGLAYEGPALSTKEDLLYLSSLIALANGDVFPLSMMDKQSTALKGKPTWISKHEVNDTTLPGFKISKMKGIQRIDESEISLDMIFLDAPWRSVRDKDLRPTYDIFPDTILTTNPERHITEERMKSDYWYSDTEMDIPRRRFLAGCIMNGPMFTGRLWAQLKRDVVGPRYNVGYNKDLAPNPAFQSAAKALLAQLVPVSTLLGIAQPSTATLDDAALFLTWLTDPRSLYYIGLRTFRVPCTMYWDSTIITSLTVNEFHKDGPDRELQAAVPVDLVGTSCLHPRVWILRPAKGEGGEGKWRIVGKGMLLGEPDLLAEVESSKGRVGAKVILKEGVIVGG